MENEKRLTEKHYNGDGYYMLCPGVFGCDGRCGNCEELDKLIDRLGEYEDKAEQTMDAVEVVHARWKYYHKQNIAVCTNCSFERKLDADFGKAVSCPNCGAKMDGDGNG